MSVKDRDPLTGHQTTGHEWNGITELNTRVPRVVWFFIIVTHLWAVVVWILLPSWPLVTTYTKGILGLDQREEVAKKVVAANTDRAAWGDRIKSMSADEILENPELMARVNDTGHQLFGDNCAGCHGAQATGGQGFPNLIDGSWLWGGDTETVMETLRVGINSPHPFRVPKPPLTGLQRARKFSRTTAQAAIATTAQVTWMLAHLTFATISGSTVEMTKRCSSIRISCVLWNTVCPLLRESVSV